MSLTKRIIPCLDVTNGRVVKGVNFVNIQDVGDPITIAKAYNDSGADELVFLDITATSDGRETMVNVIEQVARNIFIPFTVGGGVRSIDDMALLLQAGADKISLNSAAIVNPDLISMGAGKFGSQCIVVAMDVKKDTDGWSIYTHGGRTNTGINAIEWAKKAVELGAGELLVTSMDADGTKNGYDIQLLKEIGKYIKVPIIASGGCGKKEHLAEVLQQTICTGALAASIFHYGEVSIQEAKKFLNNQGVIVRR